MSDFRFYDIDSNYAIYLQSVDSKVPNIGGYSVNNKFVCGVVFEINGHDYFAPVTSFNKPQATNFPIKDNGNILSTIRFSFMFPAPKDVLTVKDFSKEIPTYSRLLITEYQYCKKHLDAIKSKASFVYQTVIHGKNPLMTKNCCNFLKLETACLEYCKTNNIEHPLLLDSTNIDTSTKHTTLAAKLESATVKATEKNKETTSNKAEKKFER